MLALICTKAFIYKKIFSKKIKSLHIQHHMFTEV